MAHIRYAFTAVGPDGDTVTGELIVNQDHAPPVWQPLGEITVAEGGEPVVVDIGAKVVGAVSISMTLVDGAPPAGFEASFDPETRTARFAW